MYILHYILHLLKYILRYILVLLKYILHYILPLTQIYPALYSRITTYSSISCTIYYHLLMYILHYILHFLKYILRYILVLLKYILHYILPFTQVYPALYITTYSSISCTIYYVFMMYSLTGQFRRIEQDDGMSGMTTRGGERDGIQPVHPRHGVWNDTLIFKAVNFPQDRHRQRPVTCPRSVN